MSRRRFRQQQRLLQASLKNPDMKYLTAAYWIKNEARYLPEYIEFHLLQGYEHFVFYDNNSTDNTLEVLGPYVKDGLVEIRKYPNDVCGSKNKWAMNFLKDEQQKHTKWLHFQSIDERIYCPDGRKVSEFLRDYEKYGGVVYGWHLMGSDGHVARPPGLVIENYFTYCADPRCHIKTIFQPQKVHKEIRSTHFCIYDPECYSVFEDFTKAKDGAFQREKGIFMPNWKEGKEPVMVKQDKLRNLHYHVLSKEEFEEKNSKGYLDGSDTEVPRQKKITEKLWNDTHNTLLGEVRDMEKYVPIIREMIYKRYQKQPETLKTINH